MVNESPISLRRWQNRSTLWSRWRRSLASDSTQLLTRRIDEVAEDVDLGSADVRTHLNGRNDGDLSAVIVRQ